LLGDISTTARGLVDAMSDIVWSIDPRRDDLHSLITRIRTFASDMFEAKGITWEFRTPADMEDVRLSPAQRRDLFLIFKEAIPNVARHSGCAAAFLAAEITDRGRLLTVEIRDDGQGFVPDTHHGQGLTSIEARTARLHGLCTIVSAPGEGTSLRIR